MADLNDLLTLVPGTKVVVSSCEGAEHGGSTGCLCDLVGTVQEMGERKESCFAGTPSWYLKGTGKTARLSEVTILRK